MRIVDLASALGGKASSYRASDGLLVEHGWHMVVGFYKNLPDLARRAGVDPERALVSLGGVGHGYEPSHGGIFTTNSRGGRAEVAANFNRYGGLPF